MLPIVSVNSQLVASTDTNTMVSISLAFCCIQFCAVMQSTNMMTLNNCWHTMTTRSRPDRSPHVIQWECRHIHWMVMKCSWIIIIMTNELYTTIQFKFQQSKLPDTGSNLAPDCSPGLCFCLPWKYGVACHDKFFIHSNRLAIQESSTYLVCSPKTSKDTKS